MENFMVKDRRNSQRVPVKITALGEFAGRQFPLYSENINLDGMFLLSADFIPARAVFAARLWLSTDQEPLQTYLTSSFVDRTWTSYGIGACISGISTADKALWEEFYRCCLEAQTAQLARRPPAGPITGKRRLVVVDGALSPLALQGLRKPWLEIAQAASVSEALVLVKERPTDAALSDLRSPGVDGIALCREINRSRLQTRVVLLTDGGQPNDFLLGLHAGAARVIGKQCSPNALVGRILQTLNEVLPSAPACPVPASGKRDLQVSWNAPATREPEALSDHSWALV